MTALLVVPNVPVEFSVGPRDFGHSIHLCDFHSNKPRRLTKHLALDSSVAWSTTLRRRLIRGGVNGKKNDHVTYFLRPP